MSQTQTETSREITEGRGRHRGPAAVGEEARVPAQGRHRRPVQGERREG